MPSLERESAQAIEREALTWAARVDRGSLAEAEEAELTAWTAGDTRRAGAFARAMAANAYLDRTVALGQHYEPATRSMLSQMSRRRAMTVGGALAASIVAGIFGVQILASEKRIETAKGDVRRAPLGEGSAITLNTDTMVQPALGAEFRRVNLLRGEALFDVAKDPVRPFVVHAGAAQVKAVGTSFTVRLHEDGSVAVAVREGVVEVTRGGEPALRLVRGKDMIAKPGRRLAARQVSDQELERSLAWRDGRLDLTGMTLAAAAAEFARYSNRRIVVDDPDIGGRKVAGVYSSSDPNGFARAAALSLGLIAFERGEEIHIGAPRPASEKNS